MLGLQEVIIPLGIVVFAALFGRKLFRKLATEFIGIKKDIEEIEKEMKKK